MTPIRLRPVWTPFTRVSAQLALLTAAMIGLGFLVTHVLMPHWPLTLEDPAVRALVAARTPMWNSISNWVSLLAYTAGLATAIIVSGLAMRFAYGRWREAGFVAAAFLAQLMVFVITSRVVQRARPRVLQLDDFPPNQSFPSGHTSAAIAVYGGIALVLAMHAKSRAARVAWLLVLPVIPLAVAVSRSYRGMHYPSDTAGSFIVGFGCLWILYRVIFQVSNSEDRAGHAVP